MTSVVTVAVGRMNVNVAVRMSARFRDSIVLVTLTGFIVTVMCAAAHYRVGQHGDDRHEINQGSHESTVPVSKAETGVGIVIGFPKPVKATSSCCPDLTAKTTCLDYWPFSV